MGGKRKEKDCFIWSSDASVSSPRFRGNATSDEEKCTDGERRNDRNDGSDKQCWEGSRIRGYDDMQTAGGGAVKG